MPMPKPGTKESQDEFVSRFMGDGAMVKEYPDQKQRAAVAFSEWKRGRAKMAANRFEVLHPGHSSQSVHNPHKGGGGAAKGGEKTAGKGGGSKEDKVEAKALDSLSRVLTVRLDKKDLRGITYQPRMSKGELKGLYLISHEFNIEGYMDGGWGSKLTDVVKLLESGGAKLQKRAPARKRRYTSYYD